MTDLLEDYSVKAKEPTVRRTGANDLAIRLSEKMGEYSDDETAGWKNAVGNAVQKHVFRGESPSPVIHVSNGEFGKDVRNRPIFQELSEAEQWVDENRKGAYGTVSSTLEEFRKDYVGESVILQLNQDGKVPRVLADTVDGADWSMIHSHDWDRAKEQRENGYMNPSASTEELDGSYLECLDGNGNYLDEERGQLFADLVLSADPQRFDSYEEMETETDVQYGRVFADEGGPLTDENGNTYEPDRGLLGALMP